MRLKFEMNRILAWSRKILDRPDSLAIAGVHTTLSTLLIACIAAYVAFVYTTVQQAELKAFEEAGKINSIVFLVHQCPYRRVEQAEVFDKERLIDMMSKVTDGRDDPSLPKDIDGRAQKALGIMGALVGQYPFPAWSFKTREGRHGVRDEGESITFDNLNKVRAWVDSMQKTTRVFAPEFHGFGRLLPLFKEFGKGELVSKERDIIVESPLLRSMASRKLVTGFGWHITLEGLDPVIVYYDFLNRIAEAASIVKSTENHVKHADALVRGYPSRLSLWVLFPLVFVAFGCGIVYPLAAAKVRRVFALWIPFFIYVLIGGWVFRLVLWS